MIIASALGRLFNGLQIVYNEVNVGVNYGYGDQKELLAVLNNKKETRKYPLVWYVLNNYTEYDGWYETDVRLVIMQNTDSTWFNPKRKEESYTRILEPTWKKIEQAILFEGNIQVFGDLDKQFKQKAEPKYSLMEDEKSEVTDVVDALVIEFKMKINVNCIN